MYPLVIVLLSLLFTGETVSADSCASIEDRAKRLECYDLLFPPDEASSAATEIEEEAVPLTGAASTPPRSPPPPQTPPAPVAEPAETSSSPPEQAEVATAIQVEKSAKSESEIGWGINSFFNRRDAEVIESTIAALRRRETQNMIFLLANDQVWLQAVPRSIDTFHTGDRVTIKSGTLGGFFMTSADGTITRVRRIK